MKRANVWKIVWAVALCALALGACAKPQASAPDRNPASANDGARVYITNCSSCHQLDGNGIPGAFPALASNPVVTGDPARTIAIVKFGTPKMPGWGGVISDDDIAAVVTYIRTAWHNRASPVSPADVSEAR